MSKEAITNQSQKIEGYRTLAEPFAKELAGLTIEVQANVYPGGTDSELLASCIDVKTGESALDLCTGNGIVALSMYAKGAAKVTGTDLNPAAIANAQKNKELQNATGVTFIETDMYPPGSHRYDIVSINPPYTDHEPPDTTAICFWDKDNMVVKTFFAELKNYLTPNGRAFISWSSFADQRLLPRLADEHGFEMQLVDSKSGKSGFTYYVYRILPKPSL